MTHRVVASRVRGRYLRCSGTPDGTVLRAMIYAEGMDLLPLPPAFCDASFLTSARNVTGGAQTQNSTAISYAQGYVKAQGIAVSRTVAVYRRDTKQLLVSGVSGGNGFFKLSWKGYSGKVAVVIFDDEAVGYNAKILDLIVTN